MGNINHFYLTVGGSYTEEKLTEETWQTGIRLIFDDMPLDDVGTPSLFFDAVASNDVGDSTNFTSTSNFQGEGGVNDFDPRDYVLQAAEAWYTHFRSTNMKYSTRAKTEHLTLYAVGTDGKVVQTSYGPAKAVALPKAALTGVDSTQMMPIGCTVAASTRTPNVTRRGRGRMYLPPQTDALLAVDGTLGSTSLSNLPTGVATFLSALKLDAGIEGGPVVIGGSWTTYYKITRVAVGSVVDRQNRRRRSLTETYGSTDLT